jgi:hypothetical protein
MILETSNGHYFYVELTVITICSRDVSDQGQALVLAPVLALAPLRTLNISLLNNKDTAVNSVDNNKARLKSVRRPCTSIPERITTAGFDIIRRVNVKVGDLLDLGAIGKLRNGGDVEETETGLVVGLVGQTVVDVLVVVNGAGCGLVVTGHGGLFEVLDVPDVGHRKPVLSGRVDSGAVRVDLALVELIVHDEMGLPHGIQNPTLMSVRGSDIGSARDDRTSVTETLLVGDIVDGQGILVVTVTDITAVVLLVGATVHDALSVVCVAVLASTALDVGLGGVLHVDEHWATFTGVISTGSTTRAVSNRVSELFVGNNGVCPTLDTLVDVDKGNVFLDVESLGVLGRKLEDLL